MFRRILNRVWRWSEALVATSLVWVPALVLLAASVVYLWQALATLTSPGVPVRFSYQGADGTYAVNADSYAVFLRERRARVTNARLTGPDGSEIARVGLLDARLEGPATVLEARDGFLDVVRNRDGSFALERVVPKQEQPSEARMMEVRLRQIALRYHDLSRPGAPLLYGSVPSASLLLLGSQIDAAGQLSLSGNPAIQARLSVDVDGAMLLRGSWLPGEYAPVLAHLPAWLSPEDGQQVQQIKSDSLRVGGRFAIHFGENHLDYGGEGTIAGDVRQFSDILRNARMNGTWRLTKVGLSTDLAVREPARNANFQGFVDWAGPIRVAGKMNAQARSGRDLWTPLAKALPRDLRVADVGFAGYVHWADRRYSAAGALRSRRVDVSGEVVADLRSRIALTEAGVAARVESARFQNVPLDGSVAYAFGSGRVAGSLATQRRVDIGRIASRYGVDGLSGNAQVRLVLSGSTKKPDVTIDALGRARYRPKGESSLDLGDFVGRVRWSGDRLDVQRLLLTGQNGTGAVSGAVNLRTRQMDLDVFAGGLPLEKISPELGGIALARGRVTGKFSDPQFTGTGQALMVQFQDQLIPEVAASLKIDRDGLDAQRWEAFRGASAASGEFSLDFDTKRIAGTFAADQIQLSELLDSDTLDAALSIRQGTLAGTLDRPVAMATVEANAIALQRTDAKRAQAKVSLTGKNVQVSEGFIELENGLVTYSGSYDLERRSGQAQASLVNASLDLQALAGGDLPASGRFNGSAVATIRDGKVADGTARLSLADVVFADESIGSGEIQAEVMNGRWTGRADLGTNNRFVLADGLVYDQNTKELGGTLDLLNIPLEEWLGSRGIASVAKWDAEARQIARRFSGDLTARIQLGGTTESIQLNMPSLAVEDLKIGGREAGRLEGAALFSDDNLEVSSLSWVSGDTSLRAKGRRAKDGTLSGEAQLERFHFGWLSAWDPSLPSINALASGLFELGGTVDEPRLRGSATARQATTDPDSPAASLSLDEIILDRNVMAVRGVFGAESFSGDVSATVPLSAFRGNDPSAQPLQATFTLHDRKVKDLEEFFTELDGSRSQGTVSGSAQLYGTIVDLDLTGHLQLADAVLALDGMETTLAVPSLVARYERDRLRLSGRATGSSGGSADLDLVATLPSLLSGEVTLDSIANDANLDRFALNVDNLVFKEQQQDRNKRWSLRINPSQIRGSGKLANPVLKGEIHVADLDATIPESDETVLAPTYLVNPLFQSISFTLDNPARIRTANTTLLIDGSGQLDGSLESPKANALLRLVEGVFQLPNARVALEEGGTLKFRYDASQSAPNTARLDMDLEGRTAITALRFGDTVERYDITLRITGNLLEEGGLRLDASSDPPDLSSQEILAALGQRDLIEQFARGGLRGGSGLTDAALSLAVPGITGGLTRGVAAAFKLDYVSVEYNAFEGATLSAAKTLGKGLTLSARRQLQERPGQKQRYELKLTYRLPSRNKLLSRIRFGIGLDQDRPWKLTLEYFKRF